ncbi:hypothetical protein ACKTEK_09985 [Tepidamorphus sp. 3E244]|uniref:hypothetical protein n=1 Tax=Tepidamorphus sp. 3E244 TaxID=3385498 RepID=UPI0038FBFD22
MQHALANYLLFGLALVLGALSHLLPVTPVMAKAMALVVLFCLLGVPFLIRHGIPRVSRAMRRHLQWQTSILILLVVSGIVSALQFFIRFQPSDFVVREVLFAVNWLIYCAIVLWTIFGMALLIFARRSTSSARVESGL